MTKEAEQRSGGVGRTGQPTSPAQFTAATRRMLNKGNLARVVRIAEATGLDDWRHITPSFVTLDLTWNCNYDCTGCIDTTARDDLPVVRKKQGGNPTDPDPHSCQGPCLDVKVVESIRRFAVKHNLRGVQFMGGETLLHPAVDQILESFGRDGVAVGIVTNGSLLVKHLASVRQALAVDGSGLRVSINGWNNYGRRIGWPDRGEDLRQQVRDGLRGLIQTPPDDMPNKVIVSTVAFEDALEDLADIIGMLSDIGAAQMVVIRERDPKSKEFLPGKEDTRDRVAEMVSTATSACRPGRIRVSLADNIRVDPHPQIKTYCPCPATALKTLVGADGWVYACTDHRGAQYARLVNVHEYGDDFEAAWQSDARIQAMLDYRPASQCKDIVCQRFEGNLAISMLRTDHRAWTF